MDKLLIAALAALLVMFSSFAQAEEKNSAGGAFVDVSALYVQAEVTGHSAKGKDVLVGKRLYAEYTIENTSSTSVNVEFYADREFKSWTLGVSQKLDAPEGDTLLVGIGIGRARYGGVERTSVSTGLYYETLQGTKVSLDFERYLGDSEMKYYKAYAYRRVGEHMFFGLYSETGYGTGPLVGINLGKYVRLMLTAKRDRAVATLSWEYY